RNRFYVSNVIVKWIVYGRRYLARIQLYQIVGHLTWYIGIPTRWLENGTFFHCWRSVLVSLLCRLIITEGGWTPSI
ncbi:TPA: hypothetical protein ACISXX_004453, partial [Salmonella enterica subsp. diarizonae serovar 61:l,v:z35]